MTPQNLADMAWCGGCLESWSRASSEGCRVGGWVWGGTQGTPNVNAIKIPLPPPLIPHPAILSEDRGADGCCRFYHGSPPTKANWVQSRPSRRTLASGNRAGRCHWSAGLLRDLPFTPPLHSGAAPYSFKSSSSALKTSQLRATQIILLNRQKARLKTKFKLILVRRADRNGATLSETRCMSTPDARPQTKAGFTKTEELRIVLNDPIRIFFHARAVVTVTQLGVQRDGSRVITVTVTVRLVPDPGHRRTGEKKRLCRGFEDVHIAPKIAFKNDYMFDAVAYAQRFTMFDDKFYAFMAEYDSLASKAETKNRKEPSTSRNDRLGMHVMLP
ncbi:hypothetical protein PR048_024327 [Dryococelus australis]|uniref:Uncharacterized protein n=1 Tax=Dryococelus australis TaxID=614101 RepID=A0ABQ9GNC7_9NEOP|nr:hypothetical protein PR048_024327 [Dryococelus australis]